MFESNAINRSYLAKISHPSFICTLYKEEIILPWYSVGGTGDSIYKELNFEEYEKNPPHARKTVTLDKLVMDNNLPMPDLVKIDVQGAELDVLIGGERTISHSKVVSLELPILQYNKGAPSFDNVIQWMLTAGFVPIDLIEKHRIKGCLVQVDVAFMRDSLIDRVFGDAYRPFIVKHL